MWICVCCRVPMLVLRGLLGAASVSTLFFAIHFLPLADATAFTFLAPVFVAMAAPWVLGERSQRVWPGLISCFTGVLLLTQPGFLFGKSRLKPVGIAFGLMQPVASGSAKVCMTLLAASGVARVVATQACNMSTAYMKEEFRFCTDR